MAKPTLTAGDTYPAIRGCASADGKLMPLSEADSLTFVAVGSTHTFEGAAEVIDPVEDVGDQASALGYNWRYNLDADDTETADTYTPWLKITWDPESEPKRVEWVKGGDQIVIVEAPE